MSQTRQPLTSPFVFGDRVNVDEDESILAVVTALQFRPGHHYPIVEISWLHNGAIMTSWLDAWRLTLVTDGPGQSADAAVIPLRQKSQR
jgi:hypothetical protein